MLPGVRLGRPFPDTHLAGEVPRLLVFNKIDRVGDEVARKQREDHTREEEALMARKRTKDKATKNVARKKVTQTASAKRRRGKAAKNPRKPASKTSPPNPAVPRTVESPGAVDLLRAWSPSRYSTR